MKLGAPPLCFCDNFLRRGTPQQSFHLFCSFLQIFSLLHVSYTNISLSQSLCHKVSTLVLSSTQSRIVSLYNLFCSWKKSLFWSYPPPRTEQGHFTNIFCNWMKSLFWSYPPPRTECRHSLKISLTISLLWSYSLPRAECRHSLSLSHNFLRIFCFVF